MEDHTLLRPLLLPTTTTITTTVTSATTATAIDITTAANSIVDVNHNSDADNTKINSSNSKIILRLFSVAFVGILSIWAHREASKGFEINVENCAAASSAASRRFQLFYVSNDKATRLVHSTSQFVETILYHNTNSSSLIPNKKQVNRVTLRLAGRNLTHTVAVESVKEHEFVLHISPSILDVTNFDRAMSRAVQQGMARVWINDNNAPKSLINGMVEYISGLAGLGVASDFSGEGLPESDDSCWTGDQDPRAVAGLLDYCEEKRKGFIQRLNQAMKSPWHDRTVDDALGMPAQHLCGSYISQNYSLGI